MAVLKAWNDVYHAGRPLAAVPDNTSAQVEIWAKSTRFQFVTWFRLECTCQTKITKLPKGGIKDSTAAPWSLLTGPDPQTFS